MEDNVVDFDAIRRKYNQQKRFSGIKLRLKNAVVRIKEFCTNNPEIAFFAVTTIVGALGFIGKSGFRMLKLHKEEQVKDLYCYDRSLGHYWKLRRELTNDEWVTIDKRKRDGEKLADILDELKVLK